MWEELFLLTSRNENYIITVKGQEMGKMNLLKSRYTGKLGKTTGTDWKGQAVVKSNGWQRSSNSPAQISALNGMGLIQRLFNPVISAIPFLDFGKNKKLTERQNFIHNCKHFIKEWNITGNGIERSNNSIRLINADFDHNTATSVFFQLESNEPNIFTNGNPYNFSFYVFTEQGNKIADFSGTSTSDMIELNLNTIFPAPDWTQAFIGVVEIENTTLQPVFHCTQSIKLDPSSFMPATPVVIASITLDSVDATNVYYTITLTDQSYWTRVTGVNLRLQFLSWSSAINETLDSVITNGNVVVPLTSIGDNYYLANTMYVRVRLTNVNGAEAIESTETIETPPWQYFPPSTITITSFSWNNKNTTSSNFNCTLSDSRYFDNDNYCETVSYLSDASGAYFLKDNDEQYESNVRFQIGGYDPMPDWSQAAYLTVLFYTHEGQAPINTRITIPVQPDWFTGGDPG